ncbi:low specificity L-threonine aldolase [Thalassovita sp.]|uniref:threonine aldolase family protein n=1 Tax=Thalassovita sp. TaxID=1979401 RepID=UPI002881CA1E|nr:low specificity L-threonine aldolase [Thalassovita sp.]MDF1804609.1 low specificity L-threonine aldolase [Thalassovita sp.]
MFFASDNSGPVHPHIMAAVTAANQGYALGYGNDPQMGLVRDQLRDLFEAPEAAIYLVATGTAANSLALATLCSPWQTVFCTPTAHIHEDECNAPEFYSGGAKLTLVGRTDKMTPDSLRASILTEENRGVHGPQRGPVSITQVTERGQIYTLQELQELTAVAREFDLPVYMDGARFANALVALNCSPAEMTWKSGIDAVSFGGTKNGCMGVEAVIFFDPKKAWEFELRRKRGAHLFSKHRYLSAQMLGYLQDDLWLDLARTANANAARLVDGLKGIPGAELLYPSQANMAFVDMPRALHQRLHDADATYYITRGALDGTDPNEPLTGRFVCDWSIGADQIDTFLAATQD